MSEQRWTIYVCPHCRVMSDGLSAKTVWGHAFECAYESLNPEAVEVVPASLLEERDRQLASSNEHNTAFLQAIVEHEADKDALRSQLSEAQEIINAAVARGDAWYTQIFSLRSRVKQLEAVEGATRNVVLAYDAWWNEGHAYVDGPLQDAMNALAAVLESEVAT